MASTWGNNTWNANSWQSDIVTVSLTSPASISALGTPQSFNVEGWGRQAWNNSGWGVEYSVEPSGQSITSAVGSVQAVELQVVELTGISINVDATFPTVENTTFVSLTGQLITSSLGTADGFNEAGWGRQAWNNSGWGVAFTVQVGGVSTTASVGSVQARNVETVELTGQAISSSVGEISPADVVGVSTAGVITSTLGALTNVGTLVGWGRNGWNEESYGTSINSLVVLSGVSATLNVGSLTPADVVGLTGVSATASPGSLTPADVMGLTGVEATASVAELGTSDRFGIQAYQAIDTGSNTSYTDVAA